MRFTSLSRALPLLLLCCAGCAEMEGEAVFAPWGGTVTGTAAGCGGAEPPAFLLSGRVYPVPVETRRLPAFDALTPVGTLCMDRLAVGWRKGSPGFPGITNRVEWFGIDFRGTFLVDRPGTYQFRLASDDGSRLYIDGALVIDNDGYHDVRALEGPVTLAAGPHTIAVPFWQGPGPLALTLEVASPGEGYQVFRMDRPLGGRAP